MPNRRFPAGSDPTRARAKQLRETTTKAERILWSALSGRKCGGLKFRRQHPIEPYIVDVYCAQANLVVEIDGESHEGRQDDDCRRDEYLENSGYESCASPTITCLRTSMELRRRSFVQRVGLVVIREPIARSQHSPRLSPSPNPSPSFCRSGLSCWQSPSRQNDGEGGRSSRSPIRTRPTPFGFAASPQRAWVTQPERSPTVPLRGWEIASGFARRSTSARNCKLTKYGGVTHEWQFVLWCRRLLTRGQGCRRGRSDSSQCCGDPVRRPWDGDSGLSRPLTIRGQLSTLAKRANRHRSRTSSPIAPDRHRGSNQG